MADHAPPPPRVLSVIFCERVIVDGVTGQYSIIGMVQHIQTAGFPAMMPMACIFTELTNGRGLNRLMFRVVDVNEERKPVAEGELDVPMDDPLMVYAVTFRITNAIFSEPGEYRAQVYGRGELLLERRILVAPVKKPEPPAD